MKSQILRLLQTDDSCLPRYANLERNTDFEQPNVKHCQTSLRDSWRYISFIPVFSAYSVHKLHFLTDSLTAVQWILLAKDISKLTFDFWPWKWCPSHVWR